MKRKPKSLCPHGFPTQLSACPECRNSKLEALGRTAHVHSDTCPDNGYACGKLWEEAAGIKYAVSKSKPRRTSKPQAMKPSPLSTLGECERRGAMIYGPDEGPGTAPYLAECVDEETAALIVRAVNAHAQAVALAVSIAGDFRHDHNAQMDAEEGGWAGHRKDEPDCSYCAMIENAAKFLRAAGEEV